ncbi:hypothetical protein [Bosea sp. 685]|uniref:hypothetical protein n=1 Tax=Bosea sp. 685 TaxID=3080057 RepID=UPI0028938215|nr:hypothetical protein [Bosea sp. 685]WNJ87946.1 hypothetical protein RMR04_00920 [Bosea sp. 685]
MAFSHALSLMSTLDGRRRIDTILLTTECFGQRRSVREALSAKIAGNTELFDLVETGPGVEIPFETMSSLEINDKAGIANGVDAELSVLLALKEAKSAVEKNARDRGSPPTIFIELISSL